MDDKFFEYLITFAAGFIALSIKYLQGKLQSVKAIFAEILIIVTVVFFILPAVIEYFELSPKIGYLMSWVLSYFNDPLLKKLGVKMEKKIEDL
jgi:hypothetical protein